MSMGVHHPYHLDSYADDEDPSQMIIRPRWDAPHVRCFPRTYCAWPCLLRQVGTVLSSPYDCVVAGLAYAKPRVPTKCFAYQETSAKIEHLSGNIASCIESATQQSRTEGHLLFWPKHMGLWQRSKAS